MSATVLRTVAEVCAFRDLLARTGQRLALVPTMGALHDGHLSLMREGSRRADIVAVSIFVNPTQFAPHEDLSRYPRDLEGDVAKCEQAGVSLVFAPAPEQVYPPGFQTHVEVTGVSHGLDGERRPGHFRGVATVVTKLLALFRPHLALFGEKDYQQLQVIRALNADLNLGAEIVGMPTLRDADGLAMSSRNVYLSAEERGWALSLPRALQHAQRLQGAGLLEVSALIETVRKGLAAPVREDYVAVVDAQTLQPLETVDRPARLLAAVFVGKTRLIDNLGLGPKAQK